MSTTNNASNALLQYLNSLLVEADTNTNGFHYESGEIRILTKGREIAEPTPEPKVDSDVLNLVPIKVANIPLALSSEFVAKIVNIRRADLCPVNSSDGVAIHKFKDNGRDVYVFDLRDIILPSGHTARQDVVKAGDAKLLLLKGTEYGLLCDSVGETEEMRREDVEWRSQRSSRRWLAGMVKQSSHALLDEVVVIQMCRELSNISN